MRYDWSGSTILPRTIIPAKRFVLGAEHVPIAADLREWIAPTDSQVLKEVIDALEVPSTKAPGTFDERARRVWSWVARTIRYVEDIAAQSRADFWQFPSETIVLRQGDCEDCAVLLVSLLLASGISPFCARVVLGSVHERRQSCFHAWPIYKDEAGVWRVLEATLARAPRGWPSADDLARRGAAPQYIPSICLNAHHVWSVGALPASEAARYVARHLAQRRAGAPVLISRLRKHFASRSSAAATGVLDGMDRNRSHRLRHRRGW